EGEAELRVTVSDPSPFAVSTSALVIPPSSSARLAVRFEPTAPGDASAFLLLTTNDPDEPTVTVTLSGLGTGDADASMALPDGGVGPGTVIDGGCGCRSTGGGSSPLGALLAAIAAGLMLRRRRASAR